MFFSAELLSRRDNGFGLLWLAATLGSKSVFKKLPKRSVMTADIAQLCDLIAEPSEPLALRLSSNLMVGVARVYKVKQEILYADVSNCVASLKKVVLELQAEGSKAGQLQMAQPTVRPAAVTLAVNPWSVGELDTFVADWDMFLNLDRENDMDIDDEEYEEGAGQQRKKKKKSAVEPHEDARAEAVTLKESYDHLMSNSFDLSFSSQAPGGPADISSSQAENNFGVDPFFADGDDVDLGLGDLEEELARGWGELPPATPTAAPTQGLEFDNQAPMDIDLDYNFGGLPDHDVLPSAPATPGGTLGKRKAPGQDKENADAIAFSSRAGTPGPQLTFNQEIMSQDDLAAAAAAISPLADVTEDHNRQPTKAPTAKKPKKTRLLLDARTELTDEELKLARAQYLQGQKTLREEMEMKRFEKDHGRLIDDMIWGVPDYIQNPQLGEFWQETFKVQVEARTGAMHLHNEELERPQKRRRTQKDLEVAGEDAPADAPFNDFGMDFDLGMEMGGMQDNQFMDFPGGQFVMNEQRHSSEEPGQARREHSRHSSLSRTRFGLDIDVNNAESQPSQRSGMFPWDNAGGLSSSSGGGFQDRISIDRADVALKQRSSLGSRRDGSPGISAAGSVGGVPVSPGFERGSQMGEDYRFDVEAPEERSDGDISQAVNPVTLEKNAFNFLEYTKIQLQALPDPTEGISYDTIVPRDSNRRVAAAAFHNCLVLATKDIIRLRQAEPYAPLVISLATVNAA